jgi:hypothetical protein
MDRPSHSTNLGPWKSVLNPDKAGAIQTTRKGFLQRIRVLTVFSIGWRSTMCIRKSCGDMFEALEEEVSQKPADSSDFGQLFPTPQSQGLTVLPKEQHSFDLDTDQCVMAQSHRMSVYACKGIRNSRHLLSES